MGKYLHEFQSESDFQAFINSDSYVEPFVSSTNIGGDEWRMDYNQDNGGGDYSTMPLTFEITSDGEIAWKCTFADNAKTIEYSKNGGEWTEITSNTDTTGTTAFTTNKGNTYYPSTSKPMCYSGDAGEVYAMGMPLNVGDKVYETMMNAMMGTNPIDTIASVENESHPAPKINVVSGDTVQFRGNNTYYGDGLNVNSFKTSCGFKSSGNIMSLIDSTGFTTATTLENDYTFAGMFNMCTTLIDASNLVLPATTLSIGCYYQMFVGCRGLVTAPTILPATILAGTCYGCMFQDCISLTTAPELPASTLADSCYWGMFMGCTSLNYVKCLATDISAQICTMSWLNNVSSSGTFVKASEMNDWDRNIDGIPENWTIEDAS